MAGGQKLSWPECLLLALKRLAAPPPEGQHTEVVPKCVCVVRDRLTAAHDSKHSYRAGRQCPLVLPPRPAQCAFLAGLIAPALAQKAEIEAPSAAREIGTFSLKTKGPTPQEVTGKYVVVWEKVGSDWKL